jgi:hypothetical protein
MTHSSKNKAPHKERSETNLTLYKKIQETLYERELSNSESLDKAILAYSAGGLGLSLAFLKDVVPLEAAHYLSMLYTSWAGFVLAMVSVIASLQCSQRGIRRQLKIARIYYLEDRDDAFELKNHWAWCTQVLNCLSGVLFILAVISTLAFTFLNVEIERTEIMTKEFKGGQNIPTLEKKGAPVTPIEQKPAKESGDSTGGNKETKK